MTIRTRSIALTAGFLFVAALATAAGQTSGSTAKDAYPNGCVDCHIAGKDADMRFTALMATWTSAVPAALTEKAKAASADASKIKGKHPAMANVKANVPRTCLTVCHKRGSTMAPPFAQLMHAIHLAGGSRFLTVSHGECTNCHKLDQKSGTFTVASSAEK